MKRVKKEVVIKEAIDNKELILALDELERERGMKKDQLLESIEIALVTAYKRNFDALENVKVTIDEQTGATHIYSLKDVMEEVKDDAMEISLDDAREINKEAQIGDTVPMEIVPRDFGRIAAQTAKQVIVQKLRELERELVFDEYNERKGEIVSGIIQKADKNIVVMDLGKLEGIMPLKEQIPTESYNVNDKIRGYVVSVEKGAKGMPQVIVSRSHSDYVKKLLEFEIPEIYEGIIEIKGIARDPGYKCKVAVYSKDQEIDPVGSCIGEKGIRVQNIVKELHGERLELLEWNEDISAFIAATLAPAEVLAVDANETEEGGRVAQVIVADNQLSVAIGKGGQNVRLAAKLTGWKIDLKTETQFKEELMKKAEKNESNVETEIEETIEETVETEE